MKQIVLIEDNADIRETTTEILELADYKVFTAENGKKGVELVKSRIPDLVICDIMMPDLDGYGVLRILSKNPETSSIPFIFLTAKVEKSDIRKGMNLGADDYITKPFEEAELLEAVEIRLKKNEILKKSFKPDIGGLNDFMDLARGIDELKDLSKDRKVKTFKKKETIYSEGDYANYLFLIHKGKVKTIKTDTYDKSFVNSIYKEGDFIGYLTLFDGEEYHESAMAMENTEVAVIPKEDFLSLIRKNRDVAGRFIKMLSGNVRDREKRLLQLAYAPLRERVADALLTLKEQQGGHTDAFRISREDLANIVGTAKESLIRALSQLKKENLIDTEGQQIEILDEKGLQKTATGF